MSVGIDSCTYREVSERRSRSASGTHYRPAVPFDEMVRLCSQQLDTDPHNAVALLQRSRALMNLGKPDSAVDSLDVLVTVLSAEEDASQRNAKNADRLVDALFYRGCCHAQLGVDERAMEDFTRALELDPTFKRAAYARAASRNRQGDFAGAIEDYERAFANDDSVSVGRNAARLQRRLGSKAGKSDAGAAGAFYLRERRALSQFAAARQRGEGTPAYLIELQEKLRVRQTRRLASGTAQHALSSANVSASTSTHSSPADIAGSLELGARQHANGADANAEEKSVDTAQPQRGEWGTGGGVAGMSAMDPASLTSHSSSFYSLSDFSDDDEDEVGGGGSHSANYYVQRGLYFRKQGDLQQAIEMYTKALEIDARHFKALFNRAFCYDKLGRLLLAVQDYEKATEVDPTNAYTYYNLGISYDRLNDLARAVSTFTKAIEMDRNNNPDFFHNRGFSLRKLGNYHAAIDDYTHAIDINATHFKSRFNRGFCYDRVGQCDRAVEDYTVALQLDPKSVNVLHNRGVALEKLGRLPEALSDFSSALIVDPKSGYTYNARGLVHDQLRHVEAAISDFTEAIHLQPLNASFLCNRGYALRGVGRLAESVADYTASLALDPENLSAYNNRAFAFRKMERYEDAVRDYTVVLDGQNAVAGGATAHHDPNGKDASDQVKTLNNRAYCLARLGRFPEAVRDYTAVLAIDPANTHALHNRAISFDKSGNYHASIEDLTQLIAAATRSLRNKESDGAKRDSGKGVKETISSAYHSRGLAWLKLSRSAEAAKDFDSALAIDLDVVKAQGGESAVESARRANPSWQALQRIATERAGVGVKQIDRFSQ